MNAANGDRGQNNRFVRVEIFDHPYTEVLTMPFKDAGLRSHEALAICTPIHSHGMTA